jgi:agmatine deiminase
MPAEWEAQQAIILSWPHNKETWPSQLDGVILTYLKIIKEIAEHQQVWLNVNSEQIKIEVQRLLTLYCIKQSNVHLLVIPTYDVWARDYGPVYIVQDSNRIITDWEFNSWGGKYSPQYFLDSDVPQLIALHMEEKLIQTDFILEGGSIDVNGSGTLITTKSCLLNPNRHSVVNSNTIEEKLKCYLGIKKVLWLDAALVGDDTDGHIDNLVRFVDTSTVVCVQEKNSKDENYESLRQLFLDLKSMTDQDGIPLKVIPLQMPKKVMFDGDRLPASYGNFLITNRKVLVPTYQSPKEDRDAICVLQSLFPERQVVGIDCVDLVYGLGSIHCISQQVPLV